MGRNKRLENVIRNRRVMAIPSRKTEDGKQLYNIFSVR